MKHLLLKKVFIVFITFILVFAGLPIDVFYQVSAHDGKTHTEQEETPKKKPKKISNEEALLQKVEKIEELKDKRKTNSKTYRNSDLSYTSEVHTGAIHYKGEEGKLKDIKNKVKENKDSDKDKFKYKTTENQFSVKLAEKTGKKDLVALTFGRETLNFGLETDKEASISILDDKTVYKNISEDTDIQYTIIPEGLKEDIILHSKKARTSFFFSIDGTLTARKADKNIEFVNKDNKVVWIMSPPFMEDADGAFSHDINYSIETKNGKQGISLEISEDFVNDPKRKFPIIVDPTVNIGGSTTNTGDSYVMKGYPGYNYYTTPELRTGYTDSTNTTRSYLNFDSALPALNGGLLVKAELKGYKQSHSGSTATNVYVQKVTSPWSHKEVTWNNQPSIDTTKNYASLAANDTAAGSFTWDITSLVDEWYDGTANHGIVLRSTSEGTLGTYRKFNASEASSGKPYLAVTYSDKPAAPTGTAYGNALNSKNGYVDLKWTSVSGATGYKVLIFNGTSYQEFDVKNVTSWTTKGKKIWPTDGTCALKTDGTGGEFPDDPRAHYQKCGNKYPNNKNYWFRIIAYNNYGETTQSDAFMPTISDRTAPTTPGTPTLTNNQNSAFTFTWNASTDANGVSKYKVFMGTTPGGTDVVNGADVTTNMYKHLGTLTPRTTYYFHVRAYDSQGNYSGNSGNGNGVARLDRDASIVSYSIPSPMEASGTYNLSITVKNEGRETWTSAQNYYLGSIDVDPFTKEASRLPLSSTDAISTGQTKTFQISVNAGKDLGNYVTKWQMLKVGTGWIGSILSRNVTVVDTKPPTGTILINGGDTYTNSPNVTLSLTSQDNANGTLMQKFQNETSGWSPYENFTETKSWSLSDNNGEKTVSVVYKDSSGNESLPGKDTIILDTNFPTAKLSKPSQLQYLTGKVDILGTATDSDLHNYVLSYGKGERPESWTTIKTGASEVIDGTLAVWDTSNLAEGKYTLKLEVTDLAGNTMTSELYVWIDPPKNQLGTEPYWGIVETANGFGESSVNLSTGNLILEFTDASLMGRGLNPSINRTYNGQDESQGALGKGWRHNFETQVKEETNGDITFIDEDGSQHVFKKGADGYTAPKGVYKKLVKNSDGTFAISDLDAVGLVHRFDLDGKYISVTDKNNNRLSFSYMNGLLTEITDDVGRKVSFAYSGNKLEQLSAYNGNKVKYLYNLKGHLEEVQYIDKGGVVYRTLSYHYDEAGRLLKAIDPNGNTVDYKYNGRRLISSASNLSTVNASTGNDNPVYKHQDTFAYDLDAKTVDVSTGGVTSSTRTLYTMNGQGNIIKKVTDPTGLNIEETFVYQDHLLMESVNGKGYKTAYTYDTLGNILTKTDPTATNHDGVKTTPVTKFEYKTGTSLLTKEIDPLNLVTIHEYDTKGNRTATIDSEGFKTIFEYDSFGNLVKETSERGPLYGYLQNASFEEGDSTITAWSATGSWSLDGSVSSSGKRSIKLTANSSVLSGMVPIKKGKLPVRSLIKAKTTGISGNGVKTEVIFYDSNKVAITSKSSDYLNSNADWKYVSAVGEVPGNAEFVAMKVTLESSAGTAYIDDALLEEGNIQKRFVYSSNGLNLERAIDAYGNETSFTYDEQGNKISETNSLSQTAYFTYDAANNLKESKDRLGKITSYEYDANGNMVKQTNPLNQTTSYQYDEQNHLKKIKHPKATAIFYDQEIAREPEVVEISEITEYNALGEKVAERDGNGHITRYEYDAAGRLIKTIDPKNNQLQIKYDKNGNKVLEEDWAWDTVTDTLYPKGKTHYKYDEQDKVLSFTDPTGNENTFVEKSYYDAAGNEIKSVSGTGVSTEYRFNHNDQVIYTKESANPIVETWAIYDGSGNLAINLDALGAANYTIHDANGNLLQVVEPDGKKTSYTYNQVGDRLKLVDASGAVTEWEYDSDGQLKKETKTFITPDTNESKYQSSFYDYDSFGQMVKKTITEQTGTAVTTSKTTDMKYDELGRLVKETSVVDGKKTENRFYYDKNNNILHSWTYDQNIEVPVYVDPDGDGYFNSDSSFEYDANNRLLKETISHTGTVSENKYEDKDDQETFKNALGETIVNYDGNDRIKQVTTPNLDNFQYSYFVDDSISKVIAPGIETSFTYNGGTKVATIKGIRRGTTTPIVDLAYSYNVNEQITKIHEKGALKKSYGYTTNGYLETVEDPNQRLKYVYDGNGNILKVQNLATGKDKIIYTYAKGDRIHQKKEYNDSTGALIRTTTYTFSGNGNLTKAVTVQGSTTKTIDYGYNSDDQLVSVKETENGKLLKDLVYEYDESGNRLAKSVGQTHYHYHRGSDGEIFTITKESHLGSEGQISFYRDSIGNILSLRYNDVLYYYQFNARGDVIALTDAAGNVVVTYEYDEWGNVLSMTGNQALAQANPYRYVGKYGVFYDQDTNLYLMGWRDYDPTTGRFMVPDQYEGEEDEPTTLNRYLYAEGDPVNNIDPDGNKSKWLQGAMKGAKRYGKKAAKFYVVDDIQTLRSKKSKWYQKAGAAASIASNFVPGVGQAKIGVKLAITSAKAAKNVKKVKVTGTSLKNQKKLKVKAASVQNAKKKNKNVSWNNGWRTPDGKFASPKGSKKSGEDAERQVWDAIKSKKGWRVIEGRVSVRDKTGQLRVYDGVAVSPSGRNIGLEIKSGSATKTSAQRNFDKRLNSSKSNSAVGVGKSKGIIVSRSIQIRR